MIDNNTKIAVIGAGQSGRGYIGRFINERQAAITFIDKNEELVHLMDHDRAFCIHFYSKDRKPVYVQGFRCFAVNSPGAKAAIHDADYIFTAVGEQNLGDVAAQLADGLTGKKKETILVTCENGVNPARVLRTAMEEKKISAPYKVSQTAEFCSTVKIRDTRLDILSQNEAYFPFDADVIDSLDLKGAVPVHNFEKFFERKIYTYNCLAGLISYCGYVKNYEVYGDAANDPDVARLMDRLLADLNPALQDYFQITREDQESFAQRAMKKMKDRDILDYNIKNGRAARRKLGPTERIMMPMHILIDHGRDPRIMEFVAAAALVYWKERQGLNNEPMLEDEPIVAFCKLNDLPQNSEIAQHVKAYYDLIMQNRDHVDCNDLVDSIR